MIDTKHRPLHAAYKIRELIKLGKYSTAQTCCDENEEFYREKIAEQHAMFLEAQCAKMGVKPNTMNKLAVATRDTLDGVGQAGEMAANMKRREAS